MMTDLLYFAVMMLNVLWFGAGFHYFSIKHVAAAKLLVPESHRHSPLFTTMAAAVRFLGGMNLAFAVLSLFMLLNPLASITPGQRAALLLVLAIAHGSQFYFNIPIARAGGRKGDALWDVHRGPMKFIFIVDATLMVANAALCVVVLVAPPPPSLPTQAYPPARASVVDPLACEVKLNFRGDGTSSEQDRQRLEKTLKEIKRNADAMQAQLERQLNATDRSFYEELGRRDRELIMSLEEGLRRKVCPLSSSEAIDYRKEVVLRIEECGTRNYPVADGKKFQGFIAAGFVLDSKGGLVRTEVMRSSSVPSVDIHLEHVIQASAPFDPPPAAMLAGGFERVRFVGTFRFGKTDDDEPAETPKKRCRL